MSNLAPIQLEIWMSSNSTSSNSSSSRTSRTSIKASLCSEARHSNIVQASILSSPKTMGINRQPECAPAGSQIHRSSRCSRSYLWHHAVSCTLKLRSNHRLSSSSIAPTLRKSLIRLPSAPSVLRTTISSTVQTLRNKNRHAFRLRTHSLQIVKNSMGSVKVKWVVLGLTTFLLMVSACLNECAGSKRVSYIRRGQA